jgi:hypothetical protein
MLERFHTFQIAKEFYWACKDLILPSCLKDKLLADQLGAVLYTLSRKKLPTENQADADAVAGVAN